MELTKKSVDERFKLKTNAQNETLIHKFLIFFVCKRLKFKKY